MRDEELEAYFASMKALVANEDFKALQSTLEEQANSINSVYQTQGAEGNNGLWFRKGQLNILFFLLNLAENTQIAEEGYLESLESQAETENDPYV